MKKIFASAMFGLAACISNNVRKDTINGDKNVVHEKRKLESFSKVVCSCVVDIRFLQGDENAIDVHADKNLVNFLQTTVANDTLYISFSETRFRPTTFTVEVTFRELQTLVDRSSAKVTCKYNKPVDKFNLLTSSSGTTDLSLKANDFDCEMQSSGVVTISGSATNARINMNSSGQLQAYGFPCENIVISKNGSGLLLVNAKNEITVDHISGSGVLKYRGDATIKVKDSQTSVPIIKEK